MKKMLLFLLLTIASSTLCAARSHHRLSHGFVALRPSHTSLLQQNQAINRMGLERIGDERRLSKLVEDGTLVALPITDAVQIAPSLPSNRRYVLPMVNSFLVKLATEYYAEFHQPLLVDSAVRPASVQKKLRRHNANAAPVHGETASSHEAGCTIDLSRRMTKAQTHWLEMRFAYYMFARQAILVEEERRCFHVMVVKEIADEVLSDIQSGPAVASCCDHTCLCFILPVESERTSTAETAGRDHCTH